MLSIHRATTWRVCALASLLIASHGLIGRPGALHGQEQAVVQDAQPAAAAAPKSTAPTAAAAAKPGDTKSGEAKAAEVKATDAKATDAKATDAKAGAKPADGKPGDAAKKAEKPEPVKRPLTPKTPANPQELKVRSDAQGLLAFSFKGQTWTDVLEWLADISGLSLHWEEVPPGYLDLTTRGRYTPDEVRDLINSVLLAKGFTVLRNGEILVVANLKSLDASLVPRVQPQELDKRGTYELCKVFLDLNWLVAETVVEELKPLLSPYGKVSALKATNRVDVLDSAGNLRRIRDLLSDEQSSRGQQRLVRQFKLEHTRAAEVLETLNTLLGIKSTAKPSTEPMSTQERMMAQQQAMMAMQQQQGQPKAPVVSKNEPQVFLALNNRENTILANAPPDKMAIIEQAVLAVDVPMARGQSLLGNLPRLKIYRLMSVAPETLVKVLQDIGGLDPASKLEVDAKNKAIIAYAPLVDHVMIQSLVERLDGTGRKFEVIQLRLLRAENVAGSIENLMRGPPEQPASSRRPFYIDYGYSSGYGGSQSNTPTDKFQVDADIDHNRLLLRATEAELAEVRELLFKLGEIPPDARNASRLRVVPAAPGEETQELLKRLQRIWPSVGNNRLDVDGEPSQREPAPAAEPPAAGKLPSAKPAQATSLPAVEKELLADVGVPRIADADTAEAKVLQVALNQIQTEREPRGDADRDVEAEPAVPPPANQQPQPPAAGAAAPPIRITIGPQGLILTSPDTEALDRLEQLLADLAPSPVNFKIFTLNHTYAKDVTLLLEDVYKDDEANKKSKGSDLFETMYFGFSSNQSSKPTRSSLSKKKPLTFVPDPVTNTILVQGADEVQLAEIERLIGIYDRIEPADSNSVRRTQMMTLKYASAKRAADVVKDVYRDLLSPNDKSLIVANQQQKEQRQEQGFAPSIFSYLSANNTEPEKNVPRFKGMLSVGIDEETNTVVVSAPQLLLTDVAAMIAELDRAAQPLRPVTQVLRFNSPGAATFLRETLSDSKSGTSARQTPKKEPAEGGNGANGVNKNGPQRSANRFPSNGND